MRKLRTRPPIGGTGEEMTRLYPNGEVVVYRQRVKQMPHLRRYTPPLGRAKYYAIGRAFLMLPSDLIDPYRGAWFFVALFMGLSLVRNFDMVEIALIEAERSRLEEFNLPPTDPERDNLDDVAPVKSRPSRYGLKGITRRGARTVRCAAHLLQKTYGRGRLTFATVTLPTMPMKQLRAAHQRWNEIVEAYRLGLIRDLKNENLRAELVTVTEIQPKRHKKTGIPSLHLHTVFVGRLPYGGWAISTERHDQIWRRAVVGVVKHCTASFRSAANLQEVHSSASGYLGKYMSKGGAAIQAVIDDGLQEWLPKQWWNCSRSLSQRVKAETVQGADVSGVLLESASANDKSVWEFHREITIDIGGGKHYWLASYGRLTEHAAEVVRAHLTSKVSPKIRHSVCDFVGKRVV